MHTFYLLALFLPAVSSYPIRYECALINKKPTCIVMTPKYSSYPPKKDATASEHKRVKRHALPVSEGFTDIVHVSMRIDDETFIGVGDNYPFLAECLQMCRKVNVKECNKPGEEFKTCGTYCEPTCQRPNPVCTISCKLDVCQCRYGFIRYTNGTCIPIEECPNMKWYCVPGSNQCQNCPITGCTGVVPKTVVTYCWERDCLRYCNPRSLFSNTSHPAAKSCRSTEEFVVCGTNCEPTCFEPDPWLCLSSCKRNTCQCKTGHARDFWQRRCIPQSQCR